VGHTQAVNALAFSPDGRYLASTGYDQTVRLWEVPSGRAVRTFAGGAFAVAFRPDGRRLAATGPDGRLRVWEVETGQEVFSIQLQAHSPRAVAYSPDGRRLATTSEEGVVQVWDADTGTPDLTLKGHNGAVLGVAFSPDGRRLASAGMDWTVKVWETATGQEVLSLRGPEIFWGVAFSPDGTYLASTCRDRTVKVWEASAPTPEAQARREAHRLVGLLFDRLGIKARVLDHLRQDRTLEEPLRRAALAVAQRWREDPEQLNNRSWPMVCRPDAPAEQYRQALLLAEEAHRLTPDNGLYLNTLGVARYRLGQYPAALEALTRSASLNGATFKDPHPADLAFLAMAQHRLGQKDKARATLTRLHEAMKAPRWGNDAEVQGFLREAEALIEGKAGKGDK
jgi:hypothetical protein